MQRSAVLAPPASSLWRRLSGSSGHPLRAHKGPVGTTQGFPAWRPCCGFNPGPSVDQQGPQVGLSPGPGHCPQGTLWTEWRVLWRCSACGPCGMRRGQRGVGEDHGSPDSHTRTRHLPRALGGSPRALRAMLWPWLPLPAQPAAALALCAVPRGSRGLTAFSSARTASMATGRPQTPQGQCRAPASLGP